MSYKDLSARLRVQAENVEEDGWARYLKLRDTPPATSFFC